MKTPGRCVKKHGSVPQPQPCPLGDAQPGWPTCVLHLHMAPAGPQRGGGCRCESSRGAGLAQGLREEDAVGVSPQRSGPGAGPQSFSGHRAHSVSGIFCGIPRPKEILNTLFYCVDPDKFIRIYVLNSLLVIWKNSTHKRKTGDFIPSQSQLLPDGGAYLLGAPCPTPGWRQHPNLLVSAVLWQTHLTQVGRPQERQCSASQGPVVPAISGRLSACSLDG